MIRKLLVVFFVLALAVPALAVQDIDPPAPITVRLTILSYTQLWFQDDAFGHPPVPADVDIDFSPTPGTDYYRTTLIGKYLPTDATSGTAEDGWATGYFESFDGATIWMQSNTDMTGNIATSGDLSDGSAHTIPTWFTIAVNGYDPTIPGDDPNGFHLGNAPGGWVNDGHFPFDGWGGYAGDGNAGGNDVVGPLTFLFGGQDFWPIQDAFQMVGNNNSLFDMDAPVGPGTMKFLARCKRSGVADVAGNYTATITPTFTSP